MSGEDDDDDIWNSDNFIATIEVFLQKAEQESAVKHGTQSVIPSASSNFPATSLSTYYNGPTSMFGPSSADSKLPYVSSVSRGGYGYSGRIGDLPKVGPEIRVEENAGRPLILQPLKYQNPWTLSDGKDVHASQQSKGLGQNQSGNLQLALVEHESPVLRDLLTEKDGAISLLRTRLKEAEQQVDELRRKVSSQTSLQPAISQQRELERLSSQLLFKEHEMSEVQRVRLEKEEKLKEALAEAVSLRQEIERLKQSRLTGADGLKRRRDEGSSPLENFAAQKQNNAGTSEQQLDPGTSPWMAETTANGTPRKTSQGTHEKNASGLSNKLPVDDESPAVTLKRRTAENGCVSSYKNEPNEREKSKTMDSNKRETTAQSKETETATGMNELSYSLQQIWGFRGVKNHGKDLVAKIYASCAQDLYTLLSNEEDKRPLDCKKIERRKSESLTISEKFHSAIAKVTNGSGHPEIILGPLLEFCNLDNAKLLGSALRVLHCILQHDVTCRRRLMGRRKQNDDTESSLRVVYHLEEKDNSEEARCGFKMVFKMLADGESKQVPAFSSPRIILRSERGEMLGPGSTSRGDAVDKFKRQGGSEIPLHTDQQLQELEPIELRHRGQQGLVEGTAGTKDPSAKTEGDPGSVKPRSTEQNSCDEELNPFLQWMLHLALASTSPVVRLEAVAIIGVLVVHSEPIVGRLMFGPLLNHEDLETLLKESAGVEIQLQAVRIVHHLLHCPALFRKFCTGTTEEQTNSKHSIDSKKVLEEPANVDGNSDHRTDALVVAKGFISRASAGLMKRKLLAGLADCLKFTGTSPQGYALRRSVMRLITFIASCGDAGVAFLTQPVTSWRTGAEELTRVCKDDPRTDAMALGESASGQHIAGGLDARGRMTSNADDLEAGLVDSREDLERVINFPERLVTLLGEELEIQDEGETEANLVEERACLIREVATLLSCLASHPVQSGVVLGFLTSSQRIARLTLTVTNDLVNRKPLQTSRTGQQHAGPSNSDTAELCKSLRRRVLRALAESSELQS